LLVLAIIGKADQGVQDFLNYAFLNDRLLGIILKQEQVLDDGLELLEGQVFIVNIVGSSGFHKDIVQLAIGLLGIVKELIGTAQKDRKIRVIHQLQRLEVRVFHSVKHFQKVRKQVNYLRSHNRLLIYSVLRHHVVEKTIRQFAPEIFLEQK